MRRRNLVPALAVISLGAVLAAVVLWLPGPRASLPVGPSPSTAIVGGPGTGLPDHRLTPGTVNPAVTPVTLTTTICHSGWATSVRPPSAYTSALKTIQIREYGYTDTNTRDYQEDHLVPLEIGGAPRDPANLWPEPNLTVLADGTQIMSSQKDNLEDYLHAEVCSGRMPLADAQRLIAGDWVNAWHAAGEP
jgi:hypothetical protein